MRLTIRQIDAAADDSGYDMPATQAEYNEDASPQPAAAPRPLPSQFLLALFQ